MKVLDTNDKVLFKSTNMADVYRFVMDTLGTTKPCHVLTKEHATWTTIEAAFEQSPNNLTSVYDGQDYNKSLTIIK